MYFHDPAELSLGTQLLPVHYYRLDRLSQKKMMQPFLKLNTEEYFIKLINV